MQELQTKGGAKYFLATSAELEKLSTLDPQVAGDNLRLGCPFHGSDTQRSLAISMSRKNFKCYCCGAWGYLRDSEPFQSGSSLPQSLIQDRPASSPAPKPVIQDRPDLRKLGENWQRGCPGSPAEQYLVRRHIQPNTARSCGVAYCPKGQWPGRLETRQWARVVFPLDAPGGELVGLYSRAIDTDYPRIKAPKEVRHDIVGQRGLFHGLAALKIVRSQPVLYLTEGPFDCLAMLETGFVATVALCGTEGLPWDWFSHVQVLYLCLDRDLKGIEKACERAQEATQRGITAFIPGEDAYGGYPEPSEQYEAVGKVTLGNDQTEEIRPQTPTRTETSIKNVKEAITSSKNSENGSPLTNTESAPEKVEPDLLSWASHMAQKDIELSEPVIFNESPLRPVTTGRVSYYARHYLETISSAKFQQEQGGWGRWTPRWWQERESEAALALTNLREGFKKYITLKKISNISPGMSDPK